MPHYFISIMSDNSVVLLESLYDRRIGFDLTEPVYSVVKLLHVASSVKCSQLLHSHAPVLPLVLIEELDFKFFVSFFSIALVPLFHPRGSLDSC